MQEKDLISIVIPAYNAELFIENCLNSLSLQSYAQLEMIVVDDGSKDGTYEKCLEYQKKENRLVIVRQKNGGLSAARNTGIRTAKGKYIMFIDSDDYINHDMVKILYHHICESEADIAMCDFIKVYEDRDDYHQLLSQNLPMKEFLVFDEEEIMELLWTRGQQTIIACNKLYKKELFDQLFFPEGYWHEDEHMIHHLLYRCHRFVYDNRALYYYLQRSEGSITSVIGWHNIHDSVHAFVDRVEFFDDLGNSHHLYKSLERLTKYILEKYVVLKDKEQKKELLQIFRNYIFRYRHAEKRCEKSYWLFILWPKAYYKLKNQN